MLVVYVDLRAACRSQPEMDAREWVDAVKRNGGS